MSLTCFLSSDTNREGCAVLALRLTSTGRKKGGKKLSISQKKSLYDLCGKVLPEYFSTLFSSEDEKEKKLNLLLHEDISDVFASLTSFSKSVDFCFGLLQDL